MTHSPSLTPRIPRCLAIACAAGMLLFTSSVFAQSGLYFVPWVTVEQVYDDNIFFDSENEISDTFTRVSPQLDIGSESGTLSWLLSYRIDAEWYNDLSELDDTTARQFGVGSFEYAPDRRWNLRGNTEYTKTNSAQDLSLTPGGDIPGLVGRDEAERFLLSGGVGYQFGPRFSGDLELTWIDDELIGSSETETTAVTALVEQVMSQTRSLQYGYEYRRYEFEDFVDIDPFAIAEETQTSNTAWLGLVQETGDTSTLELRAGPRFSDGDVDPYFYGNWRRNYARGSAAVEARWDESIVLGEFTKLETRSLEGNWTHRFTSKLEARASAGYAYLDGPDYTLDIFSVEVRGRYELSRYVSLTARYSFNDQKEERIGLPNERVTHNVAMLGITFTRPRRGS